MKTSSEIKAFVIRTLEAEDPMELYFELFRQIQEDGNNILHIKGVMSRWRCACREASKEKGWKGLDETFPMSIICWNATIGAIDSGHAAKNYREIKEALGWDVKAVAEGRHCYIAQVIISALQENFIQKQKERLGLTGEKQEG